MRDTNRILILPSWYPPDGGYFFKEHSEAILKQGWQVDVLVNRVVGARKLLQAGVSALTGFRTSDENGLRVTRSVYLKVPGSEKLNIRRWARSTLKLYRRYEKKFGAPDLILVHSVTWAGYAAARICEKRSVPYIVVEHRSFFVWRTEQARLMVKPFYKPFFEKAYRNCSRVVLVADSLLTGLKILMPWIVKKTEVIPNMIREEMFLPPESPRKNDPFVFFWAGRLEHVKGIDLLLEAFSDLSRRHPGGIALRLAGRGSLRGELEQKAAGLCLARKVTFLGRISREAMQKELQAASCFVLPSRYEAFGAVLIEAMATGLPVIATRSGGPETIVNNENGMLTDPGDPRQLTDAMDRMIHRYGSFDQESIRSSALERYGETRVMEKYNELFERTIQKNS